MNNIAKEFGAGVFVMTFRPPFDVALYELSKQLDAASAKFQSITAADAAYDAANDANLSKLRKHGSTDHRITEICDHLAAENRHLRARLAEADKLDEMLNKSLESVRRCVDNMPAYSAYVTNQATHEPQRGCFLYVAEKGADSFSGDPLSAVQSGFLRKYYEPRTPPVDPAAAASDALLRHRHDNR
jgi:hypothetical protein